MKTKIYLLMQKNWGNSKVGETVAFGIAKGHRVIDGGFAKEVPDPKLTAAAKKKAEAKLKAEGKAEAEAEAKAKADAKAKAKAEAETATIVPAAETTDARPNIKGQSKPGKKNN